MIRALVVYYDGKEVPNSTVDKIVELLATDEIAFGGVSVNTLNSEDMSKIIVPAMKPVTSPKIDTDKAIQAACKLIKERFKVVLSSPVSFAISITSAVADIKKDGIKGNILFDAIRIISEYGAECCRYGLTSDVINVIKQINESL